MAKISRFSKTLINNKKRKKILLFTSGLVATLAIGVGWTFSNITTISNDESILKTNSSLNALDTSTDSLAGQSAATFTVNSTPTALNKTADEVEASDLESVLTASTTTAQWNVTILPITENNINLGYVNFLIIQTYYDSSTSGYKTTYADASHSMNSSTDGDQTSSSNYQSDDTVDLTGYQLSDGTNPETKNVFSTKKIDNLTGWITAEKYTLTWLDDSVIEDYITSRTSTDTLTAEEIWYNFLDNSSLPTLITSGTSTSQYTSISISAVDGNGQTDSTNQYGIYKVELTIYNTSTDSWSSGTYPTGSTTSGNNITITKYFGGFLTASGTRNTVSINFESNFRSWVLSDDSVFENGTANESVSSLLPTEFANPMDGTSALISVFSSGNGLKQSENSSTSSPIMTYSFIDKTFNFYDSTATSNNTDTSITGGILQEIVNNNTNIRITNIQTNPNDEEGSLQLIFTYNMYSIYSGSIVSKTYTTTLPANTFRAGNASQTLAIAWKDVNQLSQYGLSSSYDVVNQFNKNIDNTEFVRIFTNLFINASSDILATERTATVLYGAPDSSDPEGPVNEDNTNYSDETGSYTPSNTVTNTQVTIRLTFSNWNNTDQDMVFQQTFNFTYYQYSYDLFTSTATSNDSLVINWKTNDEVMANNNSFSSTTASDLAYSMLSSGNTTTIDTNYTTFFDIPGVSSATTSLSVTLLPDDENGSLFIYISKSPETNPDANAHVYSQLYVGFRKSTTTSSLVAYSWLPSDEVSSELLAIPLTSVTKQDVIDYYLSGITLFANGTLTENNVEISPDTSTSSLTVQVTMPFYNQESTSSTRTFLTKITGFSTISTDNTTNFEPPKNLTAVISVSAATVISVVLGVILICLLLRLARIRNFKNHDVLLKNEKAKEAKVKEKKLKKK